MEWQHQWTGHQMEWQQPSMTSLLRLRLSLPDLCPPRQRDSLRRRRHCSR